MGNSRKRSSKRRAHRSRRGRRFVIVVILCLAVLAAGFSLRACLEQFTMPSVTLTNPDELTIQDRYQGSLIIPKYNLPQNTYEDAKFTTQNSLLHYQDANAATGVDVSSWQGDIDWKAVKNAGIQFAFLRVGFRGQTSGGIYLDDRFEANLQGALDAGIPVGVYFYSQAVTKKEAQEEANFVLSHIRGRKITYPVAYDWEPADPEEVATASTTAARTNNVSGADVTAFTKVFCEKVRSAGYQTCYYTNKSMGYDTFDLEALSDYPIWYAEYRDLPSFYYRFAIWQYTNAGRVSGIPEPVDLDISFQKFT